MIQNEKIAEFMGFTFEKNLGWYDNESVLPDYVFNSNRGNCYDNLYFDISYDWLIPCVWKCLIISHNEMLNEWEDSFVDKISSCSFMLIYKEIIEFIDFFNVNLK